MGFPILGAMAAALPIVGDLINYRSQSNTNAASAHEAAVNRDFQEELSNTAYQRATKDMSAAGLNPMLAYSQGGASTPSGSMASFTAPKVGSGVGAAAQNYAELMQTSAQTAKTNAEVDMVPALKEKALAEARASRASAAVQEADVVDQDTDFDKLKPGTTQAYVKSKASIAAMDAGLKGAEETWAPKYFQNRAEVEKFKALSAQYGPETARAELRKARAEASSSELGLNKARAYSGFYGSQVGKYYPYAEAGADLLNSAGSAVRRFRGYSGGH